MSQARTEKKSSENQLHDGDIVIEIDPPEESVLGEQASDTVFKDYITRFSMHSLVYSKNRLFHSSEGEHEVGVRSHELLKQTSDTEPLGGRAVIRCQDPLVGKYLAEAVSSWDQRIKYGSSREWQKYTASLPKEERTGRALLNTRFTHFNERKKDETEQSPHYEIYRAFRAFERCKAGKPLSKTQGVSCSNFIAYALKVAIINKLFPEGVPKEILDALQKIQEVRTASKKPSSEEKEKKTTHQKMSGEAANLVVDFEKLVQKHLAKRPESKEPTSNRESLIKFLYSAIKGFGITNLCQKLEEFPDLFKFEGYLYYEDKFKESQARVVDHDTLLKIYHDETRPNADKDPNIIVPKKYLEKIKSHDKIEVSKPDKGCFIC